MKRLIFTFCFTLPAPVLPQTATMQSSVREAYGARLTGKTVEDTAEANRRLSTRIDNRVNGRLATRIERYRTNVDPTLALIVPTDDGSRSAPPTIDPIPQTEGNSR